MSAGNGSSIPGQKLKENRVVDPAVEIIESPYGWFACITLTEFLAELIYSNENVSNVRLKKYLPTASPNKTFQCSLPINNCHSIYEKNKVKLEVNTSDSMKGLAAAYTNIFAETLAQWIGLSKYLHN